MCLSTYIPRLRKQTDLGVVRRIGNHLQNLKEKNEKTLVFKKKFFLAGIVPRLSQCITMGNDKTNSSGLRQCKHRNNVVVATVFSVNMKITLTKRQTFTH